MTKPTKKPVLNEKSKERALAYIKKCEEGEDREVFQDFEGQVVAHLDKIKRQEAPCVFMHTFLEHVLLEHCVKERMKKVPSWNLRKKQRHLNYLFLLRCETRYIWGATSRHHATIYQDFINDTCAEKNVYLGYKLRF